LTAGLDAYVFDNTHLFLDCDLNLNFPVEFRGECSINGQGNSISISRNGEIRVAGSGSLTLENIECCALSHKNLKCMQNNASLRFKNSKLCISHDFEFDTGSILFQEDVLVSGTSKFIYSSPMGSTIDSSSVLYFNKGSIFSYEPVTADRDLIYMTDNSSVLFLDGCSLYTTKTGLILTKGKLILDNKVTFNCQGSATSEALCFGDDNASNDLQIKILADAQVNVYGALEYRNVN